MVSERVSWILEAHEYYDDHKESRDLLEDGNCATCFLDALLLSLGDWIKVSRYRAAKERGLTLRDMAVKTIDDDGDLCETRLGE